MIDTSDKNFNINLNINIKNIRTRYQYQYQYCRIQNSISISIPIPKMIKFKLNLKTIPRYLDILRSQANTQKIRASIAQLWLPLCFPQNWHPYWFSSVQWNAMILYRKDGLFAMTYFQKNVATPSSTGCLPHQYLIAIWLTGFDHKIRISSELRGLEITPLLSLS